MKNTKQFRVLSLLSASLLLVPVVSTMALVDVNIGANSSTTVDSSATIEVGADIEVGSSLQVNSDADLEIFSENIVAENDGVAKVKISSEGEEESQVIVFYKQHGKLFGFIPVTIRSKTVVESDRDSEVIVKSSLSWWGFLVAKADYNKAELESKIRDNLVVRENIKVDASASAKARVAEAVVTEIQAHAATQAMVSTY